MIIKTSPTQERSFLWSHVSHDHHNIVLTANEEKRVTDSNTQQHQQTVLVQSVHE